MDQELKRFIIDLIEEEFGPKPVEIGARWAGGTLVLKPTGDNQPKEVPLEVFWKKLTGIRESLRVLEQKINGSDALSAEDRTTFQGYITKCYGSLTTFNILFKNDKDKFVGSGDGPKGANVPTDDKGAKLTMGEARKRLGLREHGE
jgi:hypothetical protein